MAPKFKNTIIKFDALLNQCHLLTSDHFDFESCQTIFVGEDLFAFGWDLELSVTRYYDFQTRDTVKSEPRMPCYHKKRRFTLANDEDEHIYVAGGF